MAFPNVPFAPGIPTVPRPPGFVASAIELLFGDVVTAILGLFGAPQWGIFQFGEPIVVAESVVTLDYKQESTVADYPVQEGAFESYDKVASPAQCRIRFATGGSAAARQEMLDSIAEAQRSLELYDVLTPEVAYANMNVYHYDYRRSASNGLGLVVVDVWLTEVRVTATAAFSSTKSPSVAGPENIGNVQPAVAPSSAADWLSSLQ